MYIITNSGQKEDATAKPTEHLDLESLHADDSTLTDNDEGLIAWHDDFEDDYESTTSPATSPSQYSWAQKNFQTMKTTHQKNQAG